MLKFQKIILVVGLIIAIIGAAFIDQGTLTDPAYASPVEPCKNICPQPSPCDDFTRCYIVCPDGRIIETTCAAVYSPCGIEHCIADP